MIYIDGDIPKKIISRKKELMKQKLRLNQQKQDFGKRERIRLNPLVEFYFRYEKANKLTFSYNYREIKKFVQKIETNLQFFNKFEMWT